VSGSGRLERTLAALERATAMVASLVLAAMVLLLAFGPVQAVLGLGRPVQWLTEISEYGLLQLALLGGALALRHGAHPALDLVVERLPAPARRAIDTATHVATGVLGGLLLVLGSEYVLATHAIGGPLDTIALPKWPFYLCYPIGGALIVAFSAGRLARRPRESEAGA
jgi:TRAP-type C4-dicarboxylate transport system permease small subunit